ncbi:MAG TPA: twin-arginine translocase TatA/TatE family subunit [Thermoanaerobaculia bacterium]
MGELFQPTHLLLVAIIAMIFLGPKRLPELGKGLGEGIRGFRDSFKTPEPPKDTKDEPKQVE